MCGIKVMKHTHVVTHFVGHNLIENQLLNMAKFYFILILIYLRSCQDILSLFIDSSVISGPAFAHCSNPSQTNNSIESSIFAQEHLKISSRSISCCNCFDWTLKISRVGVSFPRLISMIGVTTNSLINYSAKSIKFKKESLKNIFTSI